MVEKRTIGLNFTSGNIANLLVWAPLAQSLKVMVNNENGSVLYPVKMGFWQIQDLKIKSGDIYRLIIDDKSLPDPASLSQPNGVHESSRAIDLTQFQWTDRHWKGIPMEELIIYELHTGTFTGEGTFDAIISKLDYFKELGINAIELMPIAQLPGARNWGYDGVYPFAVQSNYGGPEGLQRFVDGCHQNGLAVILDVVYNHLGPEGNYLPAFGPVFTDKYKTPWGQAINFDDAWSDGLRLLFLENALMWFRDFHIDGLRLDAVHAIKDFGASHILKDIKEQVVALNERSLYNHFLIGESDLNDIKYISSFSEGGYNLDATWCDEFHHSIHALVTKEKSGYYSDFGDVNLIAKSLNDAFVYDGIWSEHRKRKFGNKTTGIPGHKFVVFIQNHDQVGNRMLGDRLSNLVDFEILKVAAGIMMVSPFIPMLFMGEEYAEEHPFLYFTSHGDKELIRLVSEGRKKEFKAFMNEGEAPDPQSIETFLASKLNWETRTPKQFQIFSFYKELIFLRKTLISLKNTNRHNVFASVLENKDALYLIRKYQEQTLIAIINIESSDMKTTFDELGIGEWQLLLNSADTKWGGPGKGSTISGKTVSIPSQSITLWLKS